MQKKPFAFQLSAFTSFRAFRLLPFTFLGVLCFMLSALCSCTPNPNLQTTGTAVLQGEWQQDSVAGQKALLSYSLYHFKFSCDSFFMAINSFSKVNTGSDSCMNSGRWAEYAKGTYEQRNDTIHLKGQFCNPDYTLKDDKSCFRSGDYDEYFKVTRKTDSLYQFASTINVIPINARLIKRTTCHPKHL